MTDTQQNYTHTHFLQVLHSADSFPHSNSENPGGSPPLPPVPKVSSPQSPAPLLLLAGDKSRAKVSPLPNTPFFTSMLPTCSPIHCQSFPGSHLPSLPCPRGQVCEDGVECLADSGHELYLRPLYSSHCVGDWLNAGHIC